MAQILAPLAASYPGTVSPCEYFDGIAEATNTRGIVLMSEPVDLGVADAGGSFVAAVNYTGISEVLKAYTAPTSIPYAQALASAGRYRAIRVTAMCDSTGPSGIQPALRVSTATMSALTTTAVGVAYTDFCVAEWLIVPRFDNSSMVVFGKYLGNVAGVDTPVMHRDTQIGWVVGETIDLAIGGAGAAYEFDIDHLTIELL